jgi:TolB-like protein
MGRPETLAKMLRFGPYEVDAWAGKLRKRGLPMQVRGQSVEVLIALLERPGQVVTREELRHRLWPEGIFVDFENNLNAVVNRLRGALGDAAAKPKYIETLPRVGYRFIGCLLDPASGTRKEQQLRLLVLPFSNLSGDPAQDYLCDGLTEEMIGQLAAIDGHRLAVIARTTAMHYKGTRKSVGAIGRELRVDYVVEGSIRLSEGRARVSVQLIETVGEDHLWAKTYDGGLGDVLRFQDQVAHAVASQVRCAVAPTAAPAIAPSAYDAYIRGRFHGSRFPTPGLAIAVRCFEEAIAIEPRFAKAWAMLALTWSQMGFWTYASPQEAYPQAERAARRALELDDTLAEAHWALGTVHWYHDWDLEACKREYERAVELNASDASARLTLAAFLGSMESDFPRAAAEAERAQELDPLSAPIWGHSAWLYYWARQYERAIGLSRRALEMDAHCLVAYYVLGLAFSAEERLSESIQAFEAGVALHRDSMMLAYLAMACAMAGQRRRAEELLAELERRSTSQYVFPTCFAFVHLGMGNHNTALDWLDKAVEEHDSHVLWLRVSPRWDPIRRHPRFVQLVAQLPQPARSSVA